MFLDRLFRPGRWASRFAYTAGLQGNPTFHADTLELAASARGLRVAFASDFHAGATTDVRILAAACAAIEALSPDVVLLGGDFVSVRADDIHPLAELLANVHAPFGKYGVFGNHDKRANWPIIGSALEKAGVRMLVNEVVQLASPHDDVSIIGLDDPIVGEPDGTVLDGLQGTRIVLMHAPDGLLAIGDRHFDLAVCGHTHGGQVVIPGGPIPYLPHGQLSRKFPRGVFKVGEKENNTLLVSRGVGCSTLPIRVACAPEVHMITIGRSS